jgi:hypothetical protein
VSFKEVLWQVRLSRTFKIRFTDVTTPAVFYYGVFARSEALFTPGFFFHLALTSKQEKKVT